VQHLHGLAAGSDVESREGIEERLRVRIEKAIRGADRV